MVVDDCQSVRLTITRILENAGYAVIVAKDGKDALGKLSEHPSLIVLDINMPGLDGFGFCERMDPAYTDIPVVFLTTEKSDALKMLGNEIGAYLQKPVTDECLLQTIEQKLI